MKKVIGIGHQNFEQLLQDNCFYIDKTNFIKEWWENKDMVTLITRPRRFGKTLNMSMTEVFFSVDYNGRGELFQGLNIWKHEHYRALQGTYPVLFLSFASVKETNYSSARRKICQLIGDEYARHIFLLEKGDLTAQEKASFLRKTIDMDDVDAALALHQLSLYLYRYYGKKVIILLDEYDTPMQEAYVYGYWEKLAEFTRGFFNATFKTNPCLEKAILTGITRIGKESIFSDLNNLTVVTTTSVQYADSFGFTEREVFAALDEYDMSAQKDDVKKWYDGFTFGKETDIYNPWSVINYLKTGKIASYWANTSSNSLVGRLVQEGSRDLKITMECLLEGNTFRTHIDEQIIFSQLENDEKAIWSLFLASGYLKAEEHIWDDKAEEDMYILSLTNREVRTMFRRIIRDWFAKTASAYNDFIKALLLDDVDAMNTYMNKVALATFSCFDTGRNPSDQAEPERFYHGFVLGLMVDLSDRYMIVSNRESGFGRYDIMLEPKIAPGVLNSDANKGGHGKDCPDKAIIIEFKVFNPRKEKTLKDTLQTALKQIDAQQYEASLLAKGIPAERIRKYGFAFQGKTVLIG